MFGSGRPGGFTFFDQYLSFQREDGSWTHPVNMEEMINSHFDAASVCITLDGKYYFFNSSRPIDTPKGKKQESILIDRIGDIDLYWIDSGFINDLKEEILGKKCLWGTHILLPS